MSFHNKVVLVTGSSSGIGAMTSISFAKEGANVIIVGRNETKLKNVYDEITKVGKEPLIIKADITKEEDNRTILKKTIDKFGKLDVLVNNAGIVRHASIFDENLLQIYDELMNTNLRSTVLLTNLAASYLVATKGNIVNVSSVAGMMAVNDKDVTGFASYSTSKAGIEHFSRLCAVELAKFGVRVNVVSPGPVETDIFKTAGVNVGWSKFVEMTALKILTQPEEIADVILYLASDKARSVTGSNFVIDAGARMKF